MTRDGVCVKSSHKPSQRIYGRISVNTAINDIDFCPVFKGTGQSDYNGLKEVVVGQALVTKCMRPTFILEY